jgi:ligand-binding sensor domain-containing protein
MRPFFTLLLSCFLNSLLLAQTPTIIHYTSGNAINDLAFDGADVWIATEGGLVRYNRITQSSEFFNRANSPLPINEILSIAIGPDGTRWMGSRIGLLRWKNNNITVHNPPGNQLTVLRVRTDSNGDAWMQVFGVSAWLFKFGAQGWDAYNPATLFGSYAQLNACHAIPGIWVESGAGFKYFDGNTVTERPLPSSLPTPPGASLIDDWALDNNGQPWCVSGNRLCRPNGSVWSVEPLDIYPDAMALAPDGTLWLSNDFDGLRKRSPNGQWTAVYNSYLPLNGANVALYADNSATLWLGTDSEGLKTFSEGNWQDIPVSVSPIPDRSVRELEVAGQQTIWSVFYQAFGIDNYGGESICRFDTAVWAPIPATESGYPLWKCADVAIDVQQRCWLTHHEKLFRFDGAWAEIPLPAAFPFGQVYSVAAHPLQNELWIGGYGKVARYTGAGFEVVEAPAATSQVQRLLVDPQGRLWAPNLGTSEAFLWMYDGQQWQGITRETMGLSEFSYVIRDIKCSQNGHIWVLTEWEIVHFDGNSWEKLSLSPVLFGGEFSRLAIDTDEKIWIGMYSTQCFGVNVDLNLIKYDSGTYTFYPYKTTPLPYPNITALNVDSLHNVWIGFEYGGIAVFKEDGVILDTEAPSFQTALVHTRVFPNPSADMATLEYELNTTSDVWLEWRDAQGRRVHREMFRQQAAGKHSWTVSLAHWPAGTYYWSAALRGARTAGVLVKSR